jgi:hypothetical protein
MGFNNTTPSITLTAKLTPLGRKRLISTNNALITSFSLGDSDANYYATNPLTTGEVPSLAGNIGASSTLGNGVANGTSIKSFLAVNSNGIFFKPVEQQSMEVLTESVSIGLNTISGNSNLSMLVINRNNYGTDSYVNLFSSFGLPITSNDDLQFTGTTNMNGGYSDTAYSALQTTNIVVLAVDNSQYGEMIDGKTLMITLPTTAGTYTIYSTFQNKNSALNVEDANVNDTSLNAAAINNNIAFLFSDNIKKPNGNPSLSWGTGWDTHKPFSLNNKQLFNFQTNSNLGVTADTIVGVVYLDKGLIVLTNPTIVNAFGPLNLTGVTTGTTVSFDSVSTNVYQSITCIADRGEFGASTNKTIGSGDSPRISEVGLYDNLGNLIAVAKTDRHIIKNVNEFLALGIKISL